MKKYIYVSSVLIILVSCKKEDYVVNKMPKGIVADLTEVKVSNEVDPICNMLTADHLSDTVVYKNHVYGFCSSSCKKSFKENPEQYLLK